MLEQSAKNLLAAAQQVLDGLKLLLDELLDVSKLNSGLVSGAGTGAVGSSL